MLTTEKSYPAVLTPPRKPSELELVDTADVAAAEVEEVDADVTEVEEVEVNVEEVEVETVEVEVEDSERV